MLKDNIDRKVSLDELAAHVNLSPFHFQRLFKEHTGVSPRQYQASLRAGNMRTNLSRGMTVTDSLYEAGYSSPSRFYEAEAGSLGMHPSTRRKGGRGMAIHYTDFPSPLGKVLIAATSKGLCFAALGDETSKLEQELRQEFPAAEIRRSDDQLMDHRDAIGKYLATGKPHPDLPLDVQATAFQSRVWQVLRDIPAGRTRTYSDIALELGNVDLTRAVARACATNPVSIVVPCHRVVQRSGNLAGYRWGLQRKRALLDLESTAK